ncbi:hypothetical protein [Spirosoma agri]|uniref:Lipocalin-like domain-containing protein n=1 Tax=Spirosoma agri TaxID=1987381 RepID=A0A6M0IQY0_9BACT|nr:hypothetical protein [Spirosoma agri]NEU70698.1 hypothetical protein [Spirosoma agri]
MNSITSVTQPAKDIVGVWALVNKVTDTPISGSRLKFILDNRWSLTQADTTTGAVIYHHGGSYTYDGKIYTEQVEFANPNTASYVRSTAKFTVQIDDTIMTLIGIDNPWNEIWVRLKSK